ncbi:hypothetical protein F9L07_23090 [Pimelobacter simplex]|uniref:Uncharacterized protein n=1 Tax=Nocardioides simplex TaxID=2045 RepID=A0A7J5DTB4_NOCSI|nr:hypothetical protein [Pimelobacter simplex]KAB2808400.1 hypothetical protein F9L07_23090 [Pimelobacter simplex]
MKYASARRSAAALLVTPVALAGLAAVPAPALAAPNLSVALQTQFDFDDDGADCAVTFADNAPSKSLTDNGATVTQSWADTGTSVSDGNPADITDVAASTSIAMSATPIGAAGATIKGVARASASARPRLATSVCTAYARAQSTASGTFVLAQPMWATVSAQGSGHGAIQVAAGSMDGPAAVLAGDRGTGTATTLLSAGPHIVSVLVGARATTVGRRATSYSGSFTVRLAPLGEASPVTGNGRSHVTLGARSCASNTVAAGLTSKVRNAKKVVVKVDGAKAASFQGKKLKKRAFTVRAASRSKAQVTATITLRTGRTVSVSRSYLPCS